MIDALNIEIPFAHYPIDQGHRMVIDHDGTVVNDFVQLRSIKKSFDDEGSYTSSIAIQSTDTSYSVNTVSKVLDGQVTCIMIKGNPLKFLQGHNIFGISCIRSLVAGSLLEALPQLNFNDIQIFSILKLVENYQFKVTKIDLTEMFDLGTDQDVKDFLHMLPFVVNSRGNRFDFVKNTAYIGRHSTLWALKMYNKYLELSSRSKKHRLPSIFPDDLLEYSKGKLRVELVFQKKLLDRLGLTDPKLLQPELNKLFVTYIDKITMKNQHITEIDYLNLPSTYQATIALWKQGHHLKSLYANDKFYRHRRKLMKYGIDIDKPPIQAEERITYIQPLKLLQPKQVTTIPAQFQQYRAKEMYA